MYEKIVFSSPFKADSLDSPDDRKQLVHNLACVNSDIAFALTPVEKGRTLRCVVERQKLLGMCCSVTMFEEDTGKLLLLARKESTVTGAKFIIGNSFQRSIIGVMAGSKLTRSFTLSIENGEREVLKLQYTGRAYGGIEPRHFYVRLARQSSGSGEIILHQLNPQYVNGKYVLSFERRAKHASIKNFILTDSRKTEKIMLFGKLDENVFSCDIRYPLTPFEGFALACASLNNGTYQF